MAAPRGMRKVTILGALVPISRTDGTSYPAFRDDVVTVSNAVATKLVEAGVAEPVGARRGGKPSATKKPESEGAQADESAEVPEAPEEEGAGKGSDSDDPDVPPDEDDESEFDEQESEGAASDVEKPAKTAPVAAWREYALTQGADADEVAETSRADLITLYG